MYDADILVFVVPYQYIHDVCNRLLGKVKPTAHAVSCVKVCLVFHTFYFTLILTLIQASVYLVLVTET